MDLTPSGSDIAISQKLQSIWQSLSLTMPVDYGDRLGTMTEIVLSDRLTDLSKFIGDDFPCQEKSQAIDTTVIAIALGAYWHHDLPTLRSHLFGLQNEYPQLDINIQEFVLAYAIAYGCQGKITPKQLINQICQDFTNITGLSRQPEQQQYCLEQLRLAQKFVDQGASAIAAHSYGNSPNSQHSQLSAAIASSLYYAISTPHSWTLINQRAQKLSFINKSHLQTQIAIQAGAIAAAHGAPPATESNHQQGRDLGKLVWQQWAGVHRDRPLSCL